MFNEISSALDTMTVEYQPIVDLDSGTVAGFEALARIRGLSGSAVSIEPIIEEIENDHVGIERFMRQLLRLIRDDAIELFERHPEVYISVNVAPSILGTGYIRTILDELGLVPYLPRFVCEVTERQALSDEGRAALVAARENEIKVALDDFGTGQSGFAQLLGLTIDILKLDRSQIVRVTKDLPAARLVRGMVALAAVIRARVVAEGVETAAQAYFVHAAGVDYGQGWFWSAAVPGSRLSHVVDTGFPNWRHDLIARLNGDDSISV